MLTLLYSGSSSACFEIENNSPYFSDGAYQIYLDGSFVREDCKNVFSLFELSPHSSHTLELRCGEKSDFLDFTTAAENGCVNVRSFGAVGDGVHEDTEAIQAAIDSLCEGGRLLFPAGRYLTLPLLLKSHITLELAKGAVLLGSTDRERYPIVSDTVLRDENGNERWFASFEGLLQPMYRSLLTADYAEDIQLVGEGIVDGNAQNSDFWRNFHSFPAARPRLLFFNHCKGVTVHGLSVCNSPSWQIHPYYSDNVRLLGVSISAPKDSPNTDAIDPESCDKVDIIGCRFSVGDDCIAIKSGKIGMAKAHYKPASRHTVRNCLMEFGHGAITLGSESACGVEELSVSRCLFRNTDRGLRIKTRRGRGKDCYISDVSFSNIVMDGVSTPVVINMWYNCCDPDRHSEYVWSRNALPVDERTPHLGSFAFRNIVCTNTHAAACYIDGLPEMPIESVEFENFTADFAEDARPAVPAMQNFAEPVCRMGLYFNNVRHIGLKNIRLTGIEGEEVIALCCGELEKEE